MLIRFFVKDHDNTSLPGVRLRFGMLAGCVGVAANLLLFAVKTTAGIIAGSVAVIADAVNNLSDSGSALVTLFGFKMAAAPADARHPFGHGRIEYVAGLIVAVLIISVGINFLKESVTRIFNPAEVAVNTAVIVIISATLAVKLWLFFFFRTVCGKIDSQVIKASAFDSLSDMLTTSLVLGSMIIGRFTAFPVDGCAGVAVAGMVIWGGISILKETGSPLLGEKPEPELVAELQQRLLACPAVAGVHDIVIHNYGPNLHFATAHAEVDCKGDLIHMHDTLEALEVEIARSMPIRLLLHCDPFDIADPEAKIWRARMEEKISSINRNCKLYDFRLDKDGGRLRIRFHLLVPHELRQERDRISGLLLNTVRKYDSAAELDITYTETYV